jgi:hypothetical protein
VVTRRLGRAQREVRWVARYEDLRAAALRGVFDDSEDARRVARSGLWGLASGRPPWRVVVSEAPEPRWSGRDPRLAALGAAYGLVCDTK